MGLIDFILNLAGLLLWFNWRSRRFDPIAKSAPLTLVGMLKKTSSARLPQWKYPLALLSLLAVRALFYWQIGAAVNWTPSLQLGAIALAFRSDFPGHMFLFSLLSFVVALAVFFLWLILLAVVNRGIPRDPLQKLARLHLGFLDRCPWQLKLLLPLLTGALFWIVCSRGFAWLGLIPASPTLVELLEQAALIGLATYLVWKYLLVGLLLLHLLNSYVYLGEHPFWNFVNATANNLLAPLRRLPLRWGKVDFSPVVGAALVFFVAHLAEYGLDLFGGLRIPGLPQLYQRLPF
ncbi:MAG: YggT family protein [Verrucomicrobia bacterium]|nr:YggT family protein [Verrucomicrobiota bacterium]